MVKTRDAFDMRLLLTEGAVLDKALKGHLNDLVMWRELDAEQINGRIEQITPKLCRAELKSVLPEQLYSSLELEEFKSLRAAVRTLFAQWLQKNGVPCGLGSYTSKGSAKLGDPSV
jgi:hypothetical protein